MKGVVIQQNTFCWPGWNQRKEVFQKKSSWNEAAAKVSMKTDPDLCKNNEISIWRAFFKNIILRRMYNKWWIAFNSNKYIITHIDAKCSWYYYLKWRDFSKTLTMYVGRQKNNSIQRKVLQLPMFVQDCNELLSQGVTPVYILLCCFCPWILPENSTFSLITLCHHCLVSLLGGNFPGTP